MDGQMALFCYQELPVWQADEIPDALRAGHAFDEGEWACLNVLQGRLKLTEADNASVELTAEDGDHMIAPQQQFTVEPLTDDTEIKLSLYCAAKDYFNKKYGMSATHSAVVAAENIVPAGKALDMGCGQGRNALFLGLKGFDVTAVDNNPQAVQNVNELARIEDLDVRAVDGCVYVPVSAFRAASDCRYAGAYQPGRLQPDRFGDGH